MKRQALGRSGSKTTKAGKALSKAAGESASSVLATSSADRIDLMQTFVRIVESGSLSMAAAQLNTTQPTISRRLQTLERLLGVRLLNRSTHAMQLTEDGERCYERARELVADWAMFESDLRGVGARAEGRLRVVAPHAFGQEFLVAPLADFLRQHPGVSVEWHLQDRMPDFNAEAVDCAIHVGAVHEPGLVAIKLAEVPRSVIASPMLFAGRSLPRRPQDLEALPWLSLRTYYRNDIRLTRLDGSERARVAFQPRFSTDSLYALRSAVRKGLGVAVGSSWLFADDIASGEIVQLLPKWQAEPLPMFLVYPYARFYPARLRLFIEAIRQAMPKLGVVDFPPVKRGARDSGR